MKKLKRKDYLLISSLCLFIIGYVIFLNYQGYAFGSYVDWLSQHITFPEYFRNLFYENGKLLPLFSGNLGMGQNIFYFSYYGLLSPLILLSYPFPFISMNLFIQIIAILGMLSSIFLLYYWLNDKYNTNVAFIACILFTFATPLFFHSHRHLMYVNYMPFLIWALIAVDAYFKQQKRIPLIISTFFMIMTSYFFSVSGIIVIGIYALYHIFKNKKNDLASFKPVLTIIFLVIVAILLAGIILLPTLYALMVGRSDTSVAINLFSLLIPHLEYRLTFYSAYAMGMTFIYVVAIAYAGLTKRKENIFLAIILLLCMFIPVVNYLLNGLMYLDGKVFIPFIPLGALIISEFMNDLFKLKITLKFYYFLIPVIIILLCCAIGYNNFYLLLGDMTLTIATLLLIIRFKKPHLIYIPIFIISALVFFQVNQSERFVSKVDLRLENSDVYQELLDNIDQDYERVAINENVLQKVNKIYDLNQYTTTIYSSSSNKYHKNFIRNIFKNEISSLDYPIITQTASLLFNFYSGTNYLIAEEPLLGYKKVASSANLNLYYNEDVLPLGYVRSKIMSQREFDTLSYPQTVDALLNYTIVDKALDNVYRSKIQYLNPGFTLNNYSGLTYKNDNGYYYINASNNAKLQLNLHENLTEGVLLISFTMNKAKEGNFCSTNITINGITNALSCTNWKYHNNNYRFNYVLAPDQNLDTLNIEFTKGEYEISDIELSKMSYEDLKNSKANISPLQIDQTKTHDNYLVGEIDVKEDGYFKLSIPYEKKGFTIKVDGVKVPYAVVDTAFIGFELTEGSHTIEIKYVPPLLKMGIFTSIIGLILFILTALYNRINKHLDFLINQSKKAYDWLSVKINIFLITNQGYIFLFIALLILDISLRSFYYRDINFYGWFRLVPTLFTANWIMLLLLLTKYCKAKLGKTIFILGYSFSLIMFLVHAIYFSYFKNYFDYSVLTIAGEGFAYLDAVLLNIKWWVIFVAIFSVFFVIKGLPKIHHVHQMRLVPLAIIIGVFLGINFSLPVLLGFRKTSVEWDDWRNPRSVYYTFNDNNKSMMVAGMFEYNWRNLYVSYLRNNNKVTKEEETMLEENFSSATLNAGNKYTGMFAGKNLIMVQLESIDSFLITEKIMPVTYKMMKNSINFTNHYSFTSGGGSTFNSEFMVNSGYTAAYNYNQSAYLFSRNNYRYSLPNLFKGLGYSANAFHMNSSEYYSRGANYKAFGYDHYYGLKDLNAYQNNEYWLDRELVNNAVFNKALFGEQALSLSYIITYTAHMPYKTTKGNCSMLTEETGLTELECLKIQAAETDNFMKLLLENLEQNGMLDNTAIVVFTDHYLYTLEDQTLLDKYKETSNNLINHTPFFIWNNNQNKATVKKVNSQLDILPTVLNLFGVPYYPNYYLGRDILDSKFEPIVFFQDGSWYNGSTYVANGEYQSGKKLHLDEINRINTLVKRKMTLNDAVLKSNYFNTINKK